MTADEPANDSDKVWTEAEWHVNDSIKPHMKGSRVKPNDAGRASIHTEPKLQASDQQPAQMQGQVEQTS